MKFFLSVILLLLACNEDTNDCKNASLGKEIVITDWDAMEPQLTDVKLIEYDSLHQKRIANIPVKQVFLDTLQSSSRFGSLVINFSNNLYSKNTYALTMFDSIIYEISDMKIFTEYVMVGMVKKPQCLIDSLKVNKTFISPHGFLILPYKLSTIIHQQ